MVQTDWGQVVQTGIAALAAIVGALVGAWAQGRNQRRTERQQRREQVAVVLTTAITLLDEADPHEVSLHHRSLINADKHLLEPLENRRRELRKRLLTLATAHPAAKVRKLASRLHRQAVEQAEAQRERTREVVNELVKAVQRA